MNKKKLLMVADWILPPRIFQLLAMYRPLAVRFALTHAAILQKNAALKNRHAGQRCFILCNGPSVKQQDITSLKNEIVFSVSSGYMHPDYADISPRYHCVPQLTYSDKITPELAAAWFSQMHKKTGNAEVFLDCQEWPLMQDKNLFPDLSVNYLGMWKDYFPKNPKENPDLTGIIPRVQSAPIMVLMIALYMGFKEIYLLGTDHDWFVKKEYKYFYEPELLKGKDISVAADGSIETPLLGIFPTALKLWSQYHAIKLMAALAGARIYNAAPGSMLDEFERVRLEDVIHPSK